MITEIQQEIIKTDAKPSRTLPSRKYTSAPEHNNRIVIVSPYLGFNDFLEQEFKKSEEKYYVNSISQAESKIKPYINVQLREQSQQAPYLVIDFGKINLDLEGTTKSKKIRTIQVPFEDYGNWAMQRSIPQVIPNEILEREIKFHLARSERTASKTRHIYDLLDAGHVARVLTDIDLIKEGKFEELDLFHQR